MKTDMKEYAVGVDIGGTSVKLGLFDREGNILEKWEIPTATEKGPDAIFANISESLLKVLETKGISRKAVLGIGMGVPAAVTPDGHMAKAVNIGWDEKIPAEELEEIIHIPVQAMNDANAAAYGEMWKGAAKGCKNVVMVTLGTGVGGGIIANGQILVGSRGGAGEIGHIHVEDKESEKCNCGLCGCLEQYASATGIVRLAKRRLASDSAKRLQGIRSDELSSKIIFDLAKESEQTALEIVGEFGKYLAKGLGILCSVVNPEVIVIGGGVSKAGEIIINSVKPYFPDYVFPPCKKVRFELAQLGNDAGICGAAGVILNSAGGLK